MRLALISDIHGNLPALEAVLEDIERQDVDAIVCLGDVVSGPIDPVGTLDRLVALNCPMIMGNHDRWVASRPRAALSGVDQFVFDALDDAQRDSLSRFRPTAVFADTVFLCHGTPEDDNLGWLDGQFAQRTTTLPDHGSVAGAARFVTFPIVACGHTHIARSVRLRNRQTIVNPGAVGLQFIHGSPDARYGIIEERETGRAVSLNAVPYDREKAVELATANGFPQWAEVLRFGWDGPEGLF